MEILKTYDATALHSAGFMDARVLVRAPNEARWLGQRGRLVRAATMRSACSCVARQAPAALNAAPLAAPIEWLPMPHCPSAVPAPSCQGDTGVALLTSGKGELFAVNITNPEQVTMAHYVHDQTVSLAGGTQPQCGARGSMVHTAAHDVLD